jgi:1,2-phenylacetyl-CoA epoxidase PaaB subunit
MKDRVFDVFARKERGDALTHIGFVDALDAELAKVYAWRTYDEQNWFEMCIVPRSEILLVNRDDGPFAHPGAPDGEPR